MRRFFTILAALFVFVGCSQDDVVTPNAPIEKPTYYASFADAEADSRTYLDENFMLLWHNDDRISLFATTYNEEYAFADATGSNSGAFNAVDKDSYVTGNAISTTYAVYPYNAANAISNSEILTIHFPAEQSYAEDSFGRGANTMVAAAQSSSSKLLPFRNAGGYMVLKLYGENKTVKSIELKGNNEEVISGAATAEAKYGYLPLITMGAEGGKTITLTCQNAVELGATEAEATTFWIVVPPITFEEGFTITVTDADGGTYTKSTSKPTTITRNEIKSMSALAPTFTGETENPEIQEVPETWKIYYTATENNIISSFVEEDHFGANILSNNWDSSTGEGVIICDGPITQIGRCTFYHMYSLTSITIPDSVTEIGYYAFSGCNSLTSVTIGNGVTSIGKWAFSGCTSLTSVTIPDSVTEIVDGRTFYGCTSLTSVTIGNGVTEIGEEVFYQCTSLTSVTIGNSVTIIGDRAFYGCTSLTSVTIPDSVTEIGYRAFDGCISLTSVTIGNGVTEIGEEAFSNCTLLTSVTIPDSVTEIGYRAFYGCSSLPIIDNIRYADTFLIEAIDKTLATYSIKGGTKFINRSAFSGCTSLTSVTIPDSVTEIGSYAFSGCNSLTSVTIPDSVTEIGSYAFSGCNSLTSVTIGNSVAWIGGWAFSGCTSLTSVTIPDSVTEIGRSAFGGCTSLTSVAIGNNVTSIGDFAFDDCPLSEIDIPDSVISIGDYALNLKIGGVVTIGRGVTSLGEEALYLGFSKLYIKAIAPPAGLSLTTFEELAPQMYIYHGIEQTIYVPQESYDEYLTVFDSIFNDIGSNTTTVFDDYLIPYNFE